MRKIRYISDCQKLQERLLELGYEATLAECEDFWVWRSQQEGAQWLTSTAYGNSGVTNYLFDNGFEAHIRTYITQMGISHARLE